MGKRGPKSIYNDTQWRWIADRYREGYSCKALGDFLGMDPLTVHHHLKRIGVSRVRQEPEFLADRRAEFNALAE